MAIEQVCEATNWLGQLFCPFIDKSAEMNLGVVVTGGLLGGLLQPTYARLSDDHPDPSTGHFIWNVLLGIAAAGISVYVIANSNSAEPVRLLFFSVLCGLAFPAVLSSAVNRLTNRTANLQQNVANIAKAAESNDVAKTAQAADQLKDALSSNPTSQIGAGGVPIVEASAQIAVQNIARTAAADPTTASKVINELQQVGAVAKTAGYQDTLKAAIHQLDKLSSVSSIDQALKTVAGDAAKQLGAGL